MAEQIRNYRCIECGNDDITFPALVSWNPFDQTWMVEEVGDTEGEGFCEHCGEHTRIEEAAL